MTKTFSILCGALLCASAAMAQNGTGMSAQEFAIQHFAGDQEPGYNLRPLGWSDTGEVPSGAYAGTATIKRVMTHFADADEAGYGQRKWSEDSSGVYVSSSDDFSRSDASAFAAKKLGNGDRGGN